MSCKLLNSSSEVFEIGVDQIVGDGASLHSQVGLPHRDLQVYVSVFVIPIETDRESEDERVGVWI